MTEPKICLDRRYLESLTLLEGDEIRRVNKACLQFCNDPNTPGLNFHPLHGLHRHRLHTIRAGQELRVLVAFEAGTFYFLHAGHHDAVYELANRSYFALGQRSVDVGLFDLGEAASGSDSASGRGPSPATRAPRLSTTGPTASCWELASALSRWARCGV